jgi:hypothetical protein
MNLKTQIRALHLRLAKQKVDKKICRMFIEGAKLARKELLEKGVVGEC